MSLAELPLPDVPPAPDADTLAGYRFTVVPHTHWDREWYQPFEVFRMRLARAVERICDVLEADPRFTLDGQAVILGGRADRQRARSGAYAAALCRLVVAR
ncbi:MAG TPA: hypothetical protein VFU17_15725 [Candidatus Limnocylindrales bacterium]|nr:hypothetical protein [Candidatus Limnocylindrales bacterium]